MAQWTANNSGMPTTGATLNFAGSGDRMYSFVAAGVNANPISNPGREELIRQLLADIMRLLKLLGIQA